MSSPRGLVALGLVPLALAVIVGPSNASADGPDDSSVISLVEQRAIEIADGRLLSLSPDGSSIAVVRPAAPFYAATRLCIHDVATLTERVCADLGDLGAGLSPDSVVWSPDSGRLAFAELWPMILLDGDLWVMDASTGTLTNLLDDGYQGEVGSTSGDDVGGEHVITLPMFPTFTPDGTAVTFSRSSFQADEWEGEDVATVPVTGGDAVRVGDLERQTRGGWYGRKHWTADGSRLYVSLVDQRAPEPGSEVGIWVLESDEEQARQLLAITDPEGGHPRIVAVSPRGERLLIHFPLRAASGLPGSYALVDGASGAVEPIEPLSPGASGSEPITQALLSPDGTLLLTVSGRSGGQLAVRDVAGSGQTILVREGSSIVGPSPYGAVSTWAHNDTILFAGGPPGPDGTDRGILLVLDREDPSGT